MLLNLRWTNLIDEIYFGITPKTLFHISHDDLDGFSCQLVTEVANNLKENMNCNMNNEKFIWSNIPIPNKLYDSLDIFFNNMRNTLREHLYILITDLGGISPFYLHHKLEKLRIENRREDLKIHVFIVDHHVNPTIDKMVEKDDDEYTLQRIKYREKNENRGTLFYYESNNICIDYYSRVDDSAAKILSSLLLTSRSFKRYASPHCKRLLSEFTYYVSLWDTGNFGFWKSNNIKEVDDQVKYNLIFNYLTQLDKFSDAIEIYGSPTRTLFIERMADHIVDEKSLGKFMEIYDKIAKEKLIKMNKEFDEFLNRKRVHIDFMDAYNKGTSRVYYSPGKHIDVRIPTDTILNKDELEELKGKDIVIFEDDEDMTTYPYSPFAQLFLRNPEMNAVITIRINKTHMGDNISFDLRCLSDNISVQKIASANGGGGHQKAAGFPVKKGENNE